MNGKQYSLLLSFLSWLSVLATFWLMMFDVVRDDPSTWGVVLVFVVMGVVSGANGAERK
jgi:hypothetical protein